MKGKNFLQKLNFATKTPRHKRKMQSIFLLRAFAPLWQMFSQRSGEKKLLKIRVQQVFLSYLFKSIQFLLPAFFDGRLWYARF